MDTKFIVFTTNRSGSTWLMSTLHSLPTVTAQGELFLTRKRSSEKRWDSDFACERFIEAKPSGLPFRPFSVFSYLDRLYSGPGTVGFKLMYQQLGHFPEILFYLMRHRVRVIHLIRQNQLDVLVSAVIKANIGRAHILSGQAAPDKIKIALQTEDLVQQLEQLRRRQSIARKLLVWCKLPHIEVIYENLVRDKNQFQAIWNFLSIDPGNHAGQANIVKTRRGGYRDVIVNYDEVKEALANTSFAALLE